MVPMGMGMESESWILSVPPVRGGTTILVEKKVDIWEPGVRFA